jgi:hypothetical protein
MKSWGGWTRALMVGGGLAGLATGCAAGGQMAAQRSGERGLRGSVVVSGAQARSALAGPLHLLHLDYEARGTIELFSVARRAGTDADCAGPPLTRLRLHGRRPNPIDADVGADEIVCLIAGGPGATAATEGAQRISVSWHAAPVGPGAPRSLAAAFRRGP